MHFLELKARLKDFLVFSITDIEKIDPDFHKQRLSEWQKRGYLKKIRQGFYRFADQPVDEKDAFLIANTIYTPSYISLQMALSLYGLIPEAVYGITSVTSQKTASFKTDLGTFLYRHLKPELMFGYYLHDFGFYQPCKVAEAEKALLDFFYLNPSIKNKAGFRELRINWEELRTRIDSAKLKKYLAAFKSKALERRVNKFLTYAEHAEPYQY